MRNNNMYQSRTRYEDSGLMGMNTSLLMFLAGVGTGAALMYFMDPDRGRGRRALVRDQAVGLTNDARQAINATTEDLSNRAYGMYAETRKAVTGSAVSSNQGNQSEDDRSDQINTDQANETSSNTESGNTESGNTGIGRGAAQR